MSGFGMLLDYGHDDPPVDPNLAIMFEPTTPHEIFAHHPPQHHTWGDSSIFNHSVPPQGIFEQHYTPLTPDSTINNPDIFDSASFQNLGKMDEGSSPSGQYKAVKEVEEIEEHWKNLIDSEISDSTQLNTFYQTYVSSYGPQSTATNAIRMEHAKALTFACLKHYYPASQGYKIEPASLGPFAKHGMSFILAKEDQTDIWKDLPVKNMIEEAKRKKKRAPTKKELKKAYMAAQADQYNHGIAWTMGIRWNWIKPQDIAAFVVERQREVTNDTTGITTCKWSPYTYLAIIIDTFDELPNFSIENTLHRSDVLAHPLSQAGNVQEGYGILLYGRRLEFYHFSAGEDWHPDNEDEERDTDDFEPKMQVLASGARELAMDLRTTPLSTLDETFKEVAGMKVVYRGETNTSSEHDSGVGGGQD